jgi:mono/diheme cytochrome c family protein
MPAGASSNRAYHLAVHDGMASLFHGQEDDTYHPCEGGHVRAGRAYHLVGLARRNEQKPSASRLEVYLDGKCVASAPFDGTTKRLEADKLGIGDSATTPSPTCRFRGYLGGVTLWNRALSAEEIRGRATSDHFVAELTAIEKELAERDRQRLARQLEDRADLLEQLSDLGVERVVIAERAPGRDYQRHYYANFGYSCVDPDYWLHGADGGRLLMLDVDSRKLDVLLDDPGGAVRDPQVHYDGTKILFSYRRGGKHHYNLYEFNMETAELRQITDGAWDDVEPTYLPDGGIAFCSTRCKRYIGCWLAPSAILFRCDASGENLRMLSTGAFTENTPSVLPDGRILYTRWEYVNRDAVSFHHLWTMNPDGSGQMVFFGNQRPGSVFIDAQPIAGTNEIVFIDSPGHGRNEHEGFVARVSASVGPNARQAMRHVTRSASYRDPYPIRRGAYLAVRDNQLLVLSDDGSERLLLEGSQMLHEPRVIRTRAREPMAPNRTDMSQSTGTVVLSNAQLGRNMMGVHPGMIKRLLVLEDLPKPANFHGGGSQPIGHGVTSTLKRILGTVPVEPDGSAYFTVPAMRSIYFALLDEEDRSVKQMRSFVTLQPGETISCVGCHEPRSSASDPSAGLPVLQALTRPPSPIEPIDSVADVPDFPRDVQPILDKHCAGCHSSDRRDGGVNLSGDHGPVYSLAYYELLLHWQVKDTQTEPRHGTGRQPGNDPPNTTFSSASPLMDKISGRHYDVTLSPEEERQVRLWIDAGAQYPGTYAAYGTGQVGGCWRSNEPIRVMADDWPETAPAVESIERRCGACHTPRQLPRHVTARIPLDAWGDMLAWTRPLSRYSRHRIFNLSRPEESLVLKIALDEEAGGLATEQNPASEGKVVEPAPEEDRSQTPTPVRHPIVFAGTDDPDYQRILKQLEAARNKLDEIKRFDMPGFRPNEHYIREMKRYGILPASLDPKRDPVDPYETDRLYWHSMSHQIRAGG